MARSVSELSSKAQAAYAADPQLAAARAQQVTEPSAPASSSAPSGGGDVNLPDLSGFSVPGNSMGEKALLVFGILVIGLGLFSKVTGKSLNLALQGFSPGAASSASNISVAQQSRAALTAAMAARTQRANPAKVGA